MEVVPKSNRYFMPSALLVKPSGLPPQEAYTHWFRLLIVGLPFN